MPLPLPGLQRGQAVPDGLGEQPQPPARPPVGARPVVAGRQRLHRAVAEPLRRVDELDARDGPRAEPLAELGGHRRRHDGDDRVVRAPPVPQERDGRQQEVLPRPVQQGPVREQVPARLRPARAATAGPPPAAPVDPFTARSP
ncbi:hypothetical protein LUX39_39590 [Actinomadura madurae]|nr:hypothetical protein [Actinomadura madurae]MCQ0019139.1 hypothetical protein [Actinomadura madurae]